MAYDEELAERIRELISSTAFTEKKMFGGLGFMINGNMAVAAGNGGGLMVRVDPDESDDLVATTSAELMEMGGRTMKGWLRVVGPELDDAELATWVQRGVAYASGLPAKR